MKILDFGLAKSVEAAPVPSELDATQAAMTVDGAIMGTVGYMAPEQVRSAAVDRGAVLLGLGRFDEAYQGLERSVSGGAPTLAFLGAGWWDELRGQPRFIELARRIGLPESVALPRVG